MKTFSEHINNVYNAIHGFGYGDGYMNGTGYGHIDESPFVNGDGNGYLTGNGFGFFFSV